LFAGCASHKVARPAVESKAEKNTKEAGQGRTGNGRRRAGDSFQRRPLAFAKQPVKRSI
jgi:hypothetical protein